MRDISVLIKREGLQSLIEPRELKNIIPYNGDKLIAFLKDMLKMDKSKLLIVPDIDIDGQLSAKIAQDCITGIGYQNHSVYYHTASFHGINSAITSWIIQKKFTHVLIVDSSSNEVECINRLCKNGIKVCIIDHHVVTHSITEYDSECILLNNVYDMSVGITLPYKSSSCGLLVTLYFNYAMSAFGYLMNNDCWVYAATTLYSDCMDTTDPFNVSVINAVRKRGRIPDLLYGISGGRVKVFSREGVTYSINPKMNASLRLERFDILYKLLFEQIDYDERENLYYELNQLNSDLKERLKTLEERLPSWSEKEMTFLDMSSETKTVYTNFKGLLANKFADRTGNITIGYFIKDSTVYGSVRDPAGRNMRTIFDEYCEAGGHEPAFGFQIPERKFDGLINYVRQYLFENDKSVNKPIIIGEDEFMLNTYAIQQLGLINEYTTTNKVLIRLKLDAERYTIKSGQYGYAISSDKFKIYSSIPVSYGNTVLAMPVYGQKSKLKIKTLGG